MNERPVNWYWRRPGTQWREIVVPSHLDSLSVARRVAKQIAENSTLGDLDLWIDIKGSAGIVYPYRFKTRRTIEITLM